MSYADDLARCVAETLMSREGTAPVWGLVLEDAREGYARVSMVVKAEMLNGHATIHGGMIFALADTAFAYACNSRNVASVAQQASIHFMSPAREGETLIAEAQEISGVGRSGSYMVDVKSSDGRVIATFHGLSRTVGEAVIEIEEK
jgi:acyl-CoA thioesterase